MTVDGILNINKPEGQTSFSIIASLRKLTGEKRIGHAGTLDPLASGVLPVCLGRATRIIRFFLDVQKTYSAEIELGIATDTYDREGKIVEQIDPGNVIEDEIRAVLNSFKGVVLQTPPLYSALKYQGRRYYELARAGKQIEIKPRTIEISQLYLLSWEMPVLKIEVECSKGTYIRSLANDIGKALKCGGHLKSLVRTKYGSYDIGSAISLADVEAAIKDDAFAVLLDPFDSPLYNLQTLLLSGEEEADVRYGRSIFAGAAAPVNYRYCRAYSMSGEFIAVLEFIPESNMWHPDVVFAPPPQQKGCDPCECTAECGDCRNQDCSRS
ncbi:MAG TPA: tRNA pseudouridine(55) synthase TruB [Dehalococcoidia bacterium]|nr:tRNA pseudouridine(55) synthase TruB [Dehalococcoidia bacterium]